MTKRYLETHAASMKPNVKTFTAVINSCARPAEESERNDAFEIAKLTMAELSLGTYGKPNFLSYAAFLSVCCSTLAPDDRRDQIVRSIFEECVKVGEVAQLVLTKLRIAASDDLYLELVGEYMKEDGSLEIPSTWNQSIKGEWDEAEDIKAVGGRNMSHSTKLRLDAVQKNEGKSGYYSGGKIVHPESEGISWSQAPLGSDN